MIDVVCVDASACKTASSKEFTIAHQDCKCSVLSLVCGVQGGYVRRFGCGCRAWALPMMARRSVQAGFQPSTSRALGATSTARSPARRHLVGMSHPMISASAITYRTERPWPLPYVEGGGARMGIHVAQGL